jgi:CHAD domain-containing protein
VPVWGSKADKIISRRKDLQDLLGNHQDSIVSAAFLRDLGARRGIRSGQNGFSYGFLYARELAARDSLLDDLKPFL